MLYGKSRQQIVSNKIFVFDDVFRNALEKERIGASNQYYYYKTLGKIRDKFRMKNRSLCEGVFQTSQQSKPMSRQSFRSNVHTSLNIEKINNKMFKIHKSAAYDKLVSKPSTSLSERGQKYIRQIEFEYNAPEIIDVVRPKLQQIVSRHRKMQKLYREKKKSQRPHSFNQFQGLATKSWNLTPRK